MLHQILAKIVKQSVAYNFGCMALYNLPWRASVIKMLSAIRFNATFPSWGLIVKKYVPLSWTMQKFNNVFLCALMQSDCLHSSLLFEHCNRILLCDWVFGCCSVFSFEGVCMPQYFRTLPGLVQGWTQCPTLDVVLYQVLRVSEQ